MLTKHIPNFIDGAETKEWEFNNIYDLCHIDYVLSFNRLFDSIPFYQYSKADGMLMAEYKNDVDHKWWVIGYLSGDVNLPVFNSRLMKKI